MSNEMPSIENICKAVNQLIEALMAATPAAASKRIASAAAALNLRLVAGDGGEGASDLVRRARNYTKSDYTGRLLNKLADRIEALEAELADLKKEREAVDALRKHEGTPTPEIMAWAEKTFMQAEIDDLKTQINILVNVGREVWSALQTNSDYTTAILSLADVLALHPPLTDRPALEAAAAQPSDDIARLLGVLAEVKYRLGVVAEGCLRPWKDHHSSLELSLNDIRHEMQECIPFIADHIHRTKPPHEHSSPAAAAQPSREAELVKALREARFLIEEITDREGREGMTDADFAEQVLKLAHSTNDKIREILAAAYTPAKDERREEAK